jgi:2'-hydroxyisoflavone reductase
MRRRAFLALAAASAAALAAPLRAAERAARPLRLLILGGTRFIGVHITEYALERGHAVTFFNRGRTKTALLPQVERLKGDRDGQLDALRDRDFDAVIDTSGYVPRHVRLSAELLAPRVSQYLFVSTISVYPDFSVPRDEGSPVGRIADESIEKVDGETYGPLKALAEQAAERAMPGRTTIVRPGLIVGPEDNTDRFTYWPARAVRGGEILAPGAPTDRIQVIDARDLAQFVVGALERRTFGVFNLVSPPGLFSMGALLDESIAAAKAIAPGSPAGRPVWVTPSFLEAQKIAPWSDLPVWLPATGESAGFADTSAVRALAAGLVVRPIGDSVRDTLRWHLARPEAERATLKAGLDTAREAAALAAWRGSAGADG